MIKRVADLKVEIEQLAKTKGFTVESPSLNKIQFNNKGVHSIDFTFREGGKFAGRGNVIVKNASVEDQTIEQVSDIHFNLKGER